MRLREQKWKRIHPWIMTNSLAAILFGSGQIFSRHYPWIILPCLTIERSKVCFPSHSVTDTINISANILHTWQWYLGKMSTFVLFYSYSQIYTVTYMHILTVWIQEDKSLAKKTWWTCQKFEKGIPKGNNRPSTNTLFGMSLRLSVCFEKCLHTRIVFSPVWLDASFNNVHQLSPQLQQQNRKTNINENFFSLNFIYSNVLFLCDKVSLVHASF
jgi:hypothetical protein